MSQLISIGSSKHIDFIRNKLEEECKLLQAEGVYLSQDEDELGNYTFWGLNISPLEPDKPLNETTVFTFRYFLATILSELITDKCEVSLVISLIKNHYYYFNNEEQLNIYQKAKEILANENSQRRRNYILKRIYEYLEANEDLIVDGFINFRLKDYLDELEEAVDRAVDEYLMEKEYNEFIRLLRYFVDIQDPRVEKVHVLLRPTGYFQLYDGEENIINNDYLESFVVDLADSEINYEDLLISALITIAPRKIVLHLPDANKVRGTVDTIESVFTERVSICKGCSKCMNMSQHQKQ